MVPAYLLASGDYLLCSNAQLLEEESFATLAAPVVTEEESGAQSFSFAGGTPLYYDRLSEGQLVLELYDTTLDFDPALLESRFVAAAEAEPLEEGLTGTRLTLTLSEENPLWDMMSVIQRADAALSARRAGRQPREGTPTHRGDGAARPRPWRNGCRCAGNWRRGGNR